MSANRDREEEIFDAARELAAHDRAAYLAETCAQDAALRQQIEGMLKADAAARRFVATSAKMQMSLEFMRISVPSFTRRMATLPASFGERTLRRERTQQVET